MMSIMHYGECEMEHKPEIIYDYNRTKWGIDALDEKTHNYTTFRRKRRKPMAIFYTILDIAGVNAFVLLQAKEDNNDIIRREFLIQLGMELVSDHMKRRLDSPFLRKDVRNSIFDILGMNPNEAPGTSQAGKEAPPTKSKRRRCSI
ncbi:uncharacterized protein LOC126484130 [Schistocerca serialis cubense]|uniref:uncharacterized protein LOC126484130 n=1 Tax=Schistocerca serialis cubense TaxID=2023355 RepID=UPI00214E80F5|nr:uncharacterized protein LOC126484130 [Schistocerca serialis cubense]